MEISKGVNLNNINVKVVDLMRSIHPEDHNLAEKYRTVLQSIIEEIKPVLRYVVEPREIWQNGGKSPIKCIELGRSKGYESQVTFFSLLDESGKLLNVRTFLNGQTGGETEPEVYSIQDCLDLDQHGCAFWLVIPFIEIVENISAYLQEANKRHEEHLEIVNERESTLNKVLAVLKGG